MTPGILRAAAMVTGASGIAGMIVFSIADNADGALAAGLACAAAALVLLTLGVLQPPKGEIDQLKAAEIEAIVARLTTAGCDGAELRRLIRLARRLEL